MKKTISTLILVLQFFVVAFAATPQPTEIQTIQSNLIPAYSAPLWQPNDWALSLRKVIFWNVATTAGTTYSVSGQTTNLTVSGGTSGTASDGTWITLATTGSGGATASLSAAATATEMQVSPILNFQIQPTGSLSGIRYWVGLFTATPSGVDALGAISGVGLRFSTGASDTVLQEVTSNGSTQTTTPNTPAIAPVAGTTLYGTIDCSVPGQATFYINGQQMDTISTTFPAGTTGLAPFVTVTNTAAAVKSVKTGTIILSSN